LIEYGNLQHASSSAADVVALLLLRVNRSGDMSIISSKDHSEVFMSSQLLLDLVPLLPAATSDIISLLSAACVTAAAVPSLWHNSTSQANDFAAGGFLRMMDLLPSVHAAQQLHILTCANSVMQASSTARAYFRSHGDSAVASAVAVMMNKTTSGPTAAAAASILPFICSDFIDAPVNTTALPALFPTAATVMKSVSTCAQLSPSFVSVLEGIVDLLYSCRSYSRPFSFKPQPHLFSLQQADRQCQPHALQRLFLCHNSPLFPGPLPRFHRFFNL
jgi:hypothetical protein